MQRAQSEGKSSIGVLIGSTYGPILAGLLGTFGTYIISSLVYLEPWHLFNSMPQYLLIAMSFTNILNAYAFCNLHDVSWGTSKSIFSQRQPLHAHNRLPEGSDKADVLPSVKTKSDKAGEAVAEVHEKVQEDIESVHVRTGCSCVFDGLYSQAFESTVKRALRPLPKGEAENEKPNMDDSNRTFRTRYAVQVCGPCWVTDQRNSLVCTWLACNTALAVVISRLDSQYSKLPCLTLIAAS